MPESKEHVQRAWGGELCLRFWRNSKMMSRDRRAAREGIV